MFRFLIAIGCLLILPQTVVADPGEGDVPVEFSIESEGGDEPAASESSSERDEVDGFSVTTTLVTQEELARIGGAAHRVDEEDLEQLGYDNPEAVVESVPGIQSRGEDGYGLRPNIGIRGSDSDRSKKITLMEDGILFGPAPYSAPAAYYFPIMSRMVGVEVYKGPGAIKFGPNTLGGAVNLITRDIPYRLSGGVDANLGSYMTGKGHGWVGASNEWGGFLLEGVHWQSDGFKELDGGGDTGFDKQEFMLKTRLNTDAAAHLYHQLDLKLGYSREHSDETYLGLSDEDFRDSPLRRYRASQLDEMNWKRLQLQADYSFQVGEEFDTRVTLYRNTFQRSWFRLNGFAGERNLFGILQEPTGRRELFFDILRGENSTSAQEALVMVDNSRSYVSQGAQVRGLWSTDSGWFANRLELGLRVHNDSIERDHVESTFDMFEGDMVRTERPEEAVTDNRGSTFATAVWVLNQFSAWGFTVAPGARVEIIENSFDDRLGESQVDAGQFVVVPGVGVHYEIIDHLGVLAGVHRGFNPVSPGQPDEVSPEMSVNYEAGVRYSDPAERRLIEVVGYWNDYSNLLGDCGFSSGCATDQVDDQFNAGDVDVYGVEALASWSFPLVGSWRLPARISYTLTQSRFNGAFTSVNPQYGSVEEGDELPYVPEHRGSLRLGVTDEVFEFFVNASYTGEMREEAGQGQDGLFTDNFAMLDVLVRYEILEGVRLYARGENLTNTQPIASRRPFGARPVRPLVIQGGVKAEF